MKTKKSNPSVSRAACSPIRTHLEMLAQIQTATAPSQRPDAQEIFTPPSPVSMENVGDCVTEATIRAMLEPRNS